MQIQRQFTQIFQKPGDKQAYNNFMKAAKDEKERQEEEMYRIEAKLQEKRMSIKKNYKVSKSSSENDQKVNKLLRAQTLDGRPNFS